MTKEEALKLSRYYIERAVEIDGEANVRVVREGSSWMVEQLQKNYIWKKANTSPIGS